jgi:hypothetical protein
VNYGELACVVLWFLGMIPTMTALKHGYSLRPMPDSLLIVLAVVFWPVATACSIVYGLWSYAEREW